MREAGLDADIDGLGTVYGISKGSGKAVLLGSHTDTQPEGGWLDGTLGVIYGLEVARAMAESGPTGEDAVDVASWIDEEGSFGSLLGSRAFCGEMPEEVLDTARNDEGQTLRAALQAANLEGRPRRCIDPERYVGYLEAHIEQGPYLEEEGNRVGVVTGIVGIRGFDLVFQGQQNHAGTTPMPRRRDAVTALIALGHAVNTRFLDLAGDRTVWTIGSIGAEPGAMSVVPGRAHMMLQMRDADESILDSLEACVRDLAEDANRSGPVAITLRESARLAPAIMDGHLQGHLQAAARTHAPDTWVSMPSAAGHDAQVIARHLPAAMLFIPSIKGISHSFEEDTSDDDIVLGCQVLASSVESILRERSP